MKRTSYLYLVVSMSGAAILALEILGTRILGPYYGVSLFLWSALITITLASLSLGYMTGGRLADRNPEIRHISYMMLGAGVWIVWIPLMRTPVLYLFDPLGIRFAVLSASLVLFFPPLTLLGMISPFAVKLKTIDLDDLGRTAGDLTSANTPTTGWDSGTWS